MNNLYWVANYIDGEKLEQYRGGLEQKYASIDRDRLERFDLIETESKKAIFSLYLHDGQKLIYRRRTLRRMDGSPDTIIYLVGYQETFMTNAGAKSNVVINYIHQDGSIALDGPRSNLQLLDFEQ